MPAQIDFSELKRVRSRPIVVCSHPRSGTHLTIDLLRRHFTECSAWKYPGENPVWLSPDLDAALRTGIAAIKPSEFCHALRRCERPIIKTHRTISELLGHRPWCGSDPPERLLDWLRENASFCYAYRDGREVMMSYHNYWLQWQSERRSLSEFLREESEQITEGTPTRVEFWRDHVGDGTETEGVLGLNFRQSVKDTTTQLEELRDTLGLTLRQRHPLLPRPIKSKAAFRRVQAFGVRPQSSAQPHHLGEKPKKWNEAFTEEDRRYFGEVCGETLIRLGFEADNDWIDNAHSTCS